MIEKKCKNCNLWVTDDGTPYCVAKDLYTYTQPDHECDEKHFFDSEYFFSPINKK